MLSLSVDVAEDLLSHVEVALDGAHGHRELGRRVTYLIKLELAVYLCRDPLDVVDVIKAA